MPAPLSLRIKERYMAKRADGLSQQVAAERPCYGLEQKKQLDPQATGFDEKHLFRELKQERE